MTDEQLSTIRAECEAATAGPFEVWIQEPDDFVVVKRDDKDGLDPLWAFAKEADAVFVAHARRNVLDLLTEVQSLRAALSSYKRLAR